MHNAWGPRLTRMCKNQQKSLGSKKVATECTQSVDYFVMVKKWIVLSSYIHLYEC